MFKDFIINIFSSGKSITYERYKEERIQEHGVSDYMLKYFLLNFVHVFGFIILVSFVFINVSEKEFFDAFACSFLALIIIIDFFVARTSIPQIVPSLISSVFYGLFCMLVIWNGDAQGAGYLFIFIYPMLTIILTGMIRGIVLSIVLFAAVCVEFFVPGASHFVYPPDVSMRMITVYILCTGTTLVYETSRKTKDRVNTKLLEKINGINENLHNIVKERTEKIVKLHNSILKTMSSLVEYRDFVTGEHVERTQKGVSLLLEELKEHKIFGEIARRWDTELILHSVQLHDIGKIAISDLILNKPGRLTDEEYEKMKEHAFFGFRIIERMEEDSGESELLNHAKLFALTHHERWDGTGYPNGLRAGDIPLQGRIMAIADVYDALVSERPYKKAFTREEALNIIVEGRGKQFDPLLIDMFVKIYDKF